MSEESSENLPQIPHLNPPIRFEFCLIFVKILIAVMFMFPLAHYSMYGENRKNKTQVENQTKIDVVQRENSTVIDIIEEIAEIKKVYVPPSCPMPYIRVILQDLFEDYVFNASTCTMDDVNNLDKHKIPVNSSRKKAPVDPRGTIVGVLTSGLLIISLIAAILELYKAKKQAPIKNKAPLTRKCSLADLTVLKHHRKEMIRRDSMLNHDESKQAVHHRKAPPLQRSSSTPAEPISEISAYNMFNRSLDSRRNSVIENQQLPGYATMETANRSRKLSINDGKFVDRFDLNGKRISIDITSSPERKHHSRLVHRH